MIKNLFRALALVAALALALSACGSSDKNDGDSATGLDLITAGQLTVCSDVPYPPFEDFDDSSPVGFSGYDIDIVQEIANRLDLELEVKASSFDALESGQALNAGHCDLAASAMTINEERAKNLDFSDGYYDSAQSLLVAKDSDIATIADLAGKKVGVQDATTGKDYAEANAEDATIVAFPDDGVMWTAIKAGSVDALLQDLPVNLDHAEGGDYVVVETYETEEQYGFAMKKGSNLVAEVNQALADMRADGTYDTIYDSYFATD